MNFSFEIQSDFIKDWEDIQKKELRNSGYHLKDDKDISLKYFNLLRKQISSNTRKVFISKDFNVPLDFQITLNGIIDKIKKGVDLNPHLSRSLKDPGYNDGLLNDWGIHHLHLNLNIEKDGFVERSGKLLYTYFTDDAAYLLAILEHGQWTNIDLVKIIHDNWSEVLEKFRLKGLASSDNHSEKELKKFRKYGAVALINIGDNVYAPIGGGYMTSGINIEVVRISDIFYDFICSWEKELKDNFKKVIGEDNHKKIILNLEEKKIKLLKLKLIRKNINFFVVDEKEEHLRIQLGNPL